jgi:polyphosphate kinase
MDEPAEDPDSMLEETTQRTLQKLPEAPEVEADLADPSLYFNRELSWLDFNSRVLELAEDASVPLLERLRFCAIYSSNLDEFFMVRVAGITEQAEAGVD